VNSPRTTLYRDKANAKLMGVCAGVADYTGVNLFWVRFFMLLSIFIPGLNGISIPAYFIAGLLLNKKPSHLYSDPAEHKYWQGVRQNPKRTAREIRARMKDVDRRLAEVETFYVSSNPRLNAEIERLR
jgi:phage shock protein C